MLLEDFNVVARSSRVVAAHIIADIAECLTVE